MTDHIIQKVNNFRIYSIVAGLGISLFLIFFIYCAWKMDSSSSTDLVFYQSGTTLSLAFLGILYNMFFWYEGQRHRLIENEMEHVRESIDKFYLPFYDILSGYDSHVRDSTLEGKLYNLVGYRHLAEPDMYKRFGECLKNGFILPENRQKLPFLISEDIEILQHRFKRLREYLY
jgi:hypothetical protein